MLGYNPHYPSKNIPFGGIAHLSIAVNHYPISLSFLFMISIKQAKYLKNITISS
jgi:hypothetical protein